MVTETPKVYIETTIFNHYFDVDREIYDATVAFFEAIAAGRFEGYTSVYVTTEIKNAPEPKRTKMLDLIPQYNITLLSESAEVRHLADVYAKEGILSMKHRLDRLHIACAAVNGLDYICSSNFNHINRIRTKTMTNAVNIRNGYRAVNIISPQEVI